MIVTPRTHSFVRYSEGDEENMKYLGIRGRKTGIQVKPVMRDADGLENLEAFFMSDDENNGHEKEKEVNEQNPTHDDSAVLQTKDTSWWKNSDRSTARESLANLSPIGGPADATFADESFNVSGVISPICLPPPARTETDERIKDRASVEDHSATVAEDADDDLSEDSFLLSPSSIEANERDKRREEEQQQKKKVAKTTATTTRKRGKENEKGRNDAKEPETVEKEQRTSTRSTQTYPDEDSFNLSYGGFHSSPPKATPNKRTPTTPSSAKGKEKEVFSKERLSVDQEEQQQNSSIEEKGRRRQDKGEKKSGTKRKTRQEEDTGRMIEDHPPSKTRKASSNKSLQKISRSESSEDETIAPQRKRKRDNGDEARCERSRVPNPRRKEKHDDAPEKAYQRIKPIAFWRRERIVCESAVFQIKKAIRMNVFA